MFDLYDNVKTTLAVTPQTIQTTKAGTAIDLLGFQSAVLAATIGAFASTTMASRSIKLVMTECNTSATGTFTTVAIADMLGNDGTKGEFQAITGSSQFAQTYKGGYKGSMRWIKMNAVISGTFGTAANAVPISGVAILGEARHNPVGIY